MKHLHLITKIFVFLLFAFSFHSCRPCKPDTEDGKTVLVYMAANNTLSSYAVTNLAEMKKGYVPYYSDKNVLLVYYHIRSDAPKLLRLYKNKYDEVMEETVVEYEAQNSASADVLHQVLTYVDDLFPAKERGLILWSHATGWLPTGFYSNPTRAGDASMSMQMEDPDAYMVKSFAEQDKMEIELTDLAEALPFKYSYVLFDCCLMGGIEVAYEVKDKCEYVIASPTEILAAGFPYTLVMDYLLKPSTAMLAPLCEAYYNYYNNMDRAIERSATISLVKTSELDAVAAACKSVFEKGRSTIPSLDMSTIQKYYRMNHNWYYDLTDFITAIASSEDLASYNIAMNNAVKYKAATSYFMEESATGFPINRFSGLSTYIPNPENATLSTHYKTLSWNAATGMIQ